MALPQLNTDIVRAYDIRGVFGTTLTLRDAFAVGWMFAHYLRRLGKSLDVLLGYDGRISSPSLHNQLIAGLQAGGANVCSLGLISTPALYYAANHQTTKKSAIMVTASHNPPEYNGFKLVIDGLSVTQQQLQELITLPSSNLNIGVQKKSDHEITNYNILPKYIARLAQMVPKKLNAKVVWDAGNGTAALILKHLLPLLGGKHILLNHNIDGTFAARPSDPTVAQNLTQLVAAVVYQQADIGFAFDGDADRIVVVNGKGDILQGDQLLTIFATDFLQRHANAKVIVDVKTSQTVIDYLSTLGAEVILCKCGHSFIKAKMGKTGAMLGGEMSGHMFFAEDYYGFDDAIYAACLLLRIIKAIGAENTLQKALQLGFGRCVTSEIRIPCNEAEKFTIIENAARRLRTKGIPFSEIDGIRVTDTQGWWLLRASNTEACLIARFDSQDKKGLVKQVRLAEGLLNMVIHVQTLT